MRRNNEQDRSELDRIAFYGRTLSEYIRMFRIDDIDHLGDELKNKTLERHGIKIANKQQAQSVSRTCGRYGYVNKLENKYCENSGCSYSLTQLAFDEIKAAEQARVQEMYELKERMHKMGAVIMHLDSSVKFYNVNCETLRNLRRSSLDRIYSSFFGS